MALDHVFGRPNASWKRVEVLLIVYFAYRLLHVRRTPWLMRRLDRMLRGCRPWQVVVLTFLSQYVFNRSLLLFFLNGPEMYAKHYNRNFYRATWVLTALDAGFWTAMRIRPLWLRQLASFAFTLYYLFFANAADEKVRKLRTDCTVSMMRISWEKSTHPIIWCLGWFDRPWLPTIFDLNLPRTPVQCSPKLLQLSPRAKWRDTTRVKIFYAGKKNELKQVFRVLLHFPGGGFITMSPENHEDYLRKWAKHLGKQVCIVSVDYGKAPEFPYPYALDETFEIYKKISETNGSCIGVNTAYNGEERKRLEIALAGDSAGGNLAVGVTLKVIEHNRQFQKTHPGLYDDYGNLLDEKYESMLLLKPIGIMLVYAALNFDMACWIPPSQAPLLRPDSSTSLTSLMKSHKGKKYHEERAISPTRMASPSLDPSKTSNAVFSPTYLSLTSRMSYFSDRIVTPELTRAMALLYLGHNSVSNPATDMYLSPVIAPEELLAQFPKVWMMCGECDPFVDDTVIFAARVRSAVSKAMQRKQQSPSVTVPAHLAMTRPKIDSNQDSVLPSPGTIPNSPETVKERPETSRNVSPTFMDRFSSLFRRNESKTEEDDVSEDEDSDIEEDLDPSLHVTVKIYAGLSHAYLNMMSILPEAHHAVKLTSEWVEEMFDDPETAARRRRARLKAAKLEKTGRSTVGLELRDEDNIPESISYPTGAEYRVAHNVEPEAIVPSKQDRRRPKYTIGDSDDDNNDGASIMYGKQSTLDPTYHSAEHPLHEAIAQTRRGVYNGLIESQRTESLKVPRASTASPYMRSKSDSLFLSEHDLLDKRRDSLARHVYSGVESYERDNANAQFLQVSISDDEGEVKKEVRMVRGELGPDAD